MVFPLQARMYAVASKETLQEGYQSEKHKQGECHIASYSSPQSNIITFEARRHIYDLVPGSLMK